MRPPRRGEGRQSAMVRGEGGAAAGDEHGLARLKAASIEGVQGDAERLREGGELQPGGVGQWQRLVGPNQDSLCVAAGLAVAGTNLVGAQVGEAGTAVVAVAAGPAGMNDDGGAGGPA